MRLTWLYMSRDDDAEGVVQTVADLQLKSLLCCVEIVS